MLAGVRGLPLLPVMLGAKRNEKGFVRRRMPREIVLVSVLMELRRKLSCVLWQNVPVRHLIRTFEFKPSRYRIKLSTDCRGVFEMKILRVNFVHFFSLVYTGKVSVLTASQFRSFKHFLQIFQNLELPMQNSHCDHRNFDRVNQTLDPNRSGCEKWYVVIWSYIYI